MDSPESKIQNVPLADRYNGDKIIGSDVNDFSYSRMPVSSFGKNMLENMGWYEGRGVGKNPQNALHQPVEFLPRHHRLGLGAEPIPASLQRKKDGSLVASNQKQTTEDRKNLVSAGGKADGDKIRSYAGLDEKKVVRKSRVRKLEKNVRVKIKGGRHKGLTGMIVALNEVLEESYIQLELNEENVKAPNSLLEIIYSDKEASDEAESDSGLENEDGKAGKKKKKKDSKKSKALKRSRSRTRKSSSSKEKSKKKKDKKLHKLKWVLPNIRVRVICKKFQDGKLYNKKVVVTDILDKRRFLALTPEGVPVENLREKDIQTVLPPIESYVLCLSKEHRGKIGQLKQRDKINDKITILLTETLEMATCSANEAAELVSSNHL